MNALLLLSYHFLQRINRNTEQQVDRMLAEWHKPQTTLLRSTVWGRVGWFGPGVSVNEMAWTTHMQCTYRK